MKLNARLMKIRVKTSILENPTRTVTGSFNPTLSSDRATVEAEPTHNDNNGTHVKGVS